tara:strand:- start:1079 stop:1246 length:168 start_codon:yes stop_codon:yes gene_type:complete
MSIVGISESSGMKHDLIQIPSPAPCKYFGLVSQKKHKNLFNPVAKWASRKQGDLP